MWRNFKLSQNEKNVVVMVLHGGTVPGGTACEGTAGGGTVGNSAAQSGGLGAQ